MKQWDLTTDLMKWERLCLAMISRMHESIQTIPALDVDPITLLDCFESSGYESQSMVMARIAYMVMVKILFRMTISNHLQINSNGTVMK